MRRGVPPKYTRVLTYPERHVFFSRNSGPSFGDCGALPAGTGPSRLRMGGYGSPTRPQTAAPGQSRAQTEQSGPKHFSKVRFPKLPKRNPHFAPFLDDCAPRTPALELPPSQARGILQNTHYGTIVPVLVDSVTEKTGSQK